MKAGKITPELEEARIEIEKEAKKAGLNFFDTVFYMMNSLNLNQVISYGGFPKRYSHWSYGMDSIKHENLYKFGLIKISEMVINSDYCNAFLLKNNTFVENMAVIAHVYGHCDFFKNNMWFSKTNRKMIFEMDRHAEKVDKYEELYGKDEVEKLLDTAHSLRSLIDLYSLFPEPKYESFEERLIEQEMEEEKPQKIRSGDKSLDNFFNTEERYKEQEERIEKRKEKMKAFPRNMQKDVLKFLIDNARYNNPNFPGWKIEILNMIRDEAYYFAPQAMTKIMNEGWASYWHYNIMIESGLLDKGRFFDFSKFHSAIISSPKRPGPINPYYLGMKLFEWIKYKWDTGKHGIDYDNCNSLKKWSEWDAKDMKGTEKIFQVREDYNDILFLNEFLDQEFCDEHQLYKYGEDNGRLIIQSKDAGEIRNELIEQIHNSGNPLIYVKDANYDQQGQLLLYHYFDINNKILDLHKSLPVLRNIREIWGKDTFLETKTPHIVKDKDNKPSYQNFRKTIIRCTEKTFVVTSYDDNGKVVENKEMNEKGED